MLGSCVLILRLGAGKFPVIILAQVLSASYLKVAVMKVLLKLACWAEDIKPSHPLFLLA